jgi:hypothetical protein
MDEQVEVFTESGQLTITPRSGFPGRSYNGYVTESPWNLTAGQASVEVVQAASSEATTSFALVIDSNNWYRFSVEGGKLFFESMIGGSLSSAHIQYNPSEHRFWRFRHDQTNNLMLWETSSKAATWNVRHAVTPQIPMTALYVELNAGTNQVVSTPGSAVFDNFQIILKH